MLSSARLAEILSSGAATVNFQLVPAAGRGPRRQLTRSRSRAREDHAIAVKTNAKQKSLLCVNDAMRLRVFVLEARRATMDVFIVRPPTLFLIPPTYRLGPALACADRGSVIEIAFLPCLWKAL